MSSGCLELGLWLHSMALPAPYCPIESGPCKRSCQSPAANVIRSPRGYVLHLDHIGPLTKDAHGYEYILVIIEMGGIVPH